jgi:hypothetical protein
VSELDEQRLRALLKEAHGDRPPEFAALLARPRRRRSIALVLAPLAAAAAVALLVLLRPPAPPALPAIEWRDPLAFLMEPPAGARLIDSVPVFDPKGGLP